MNTHTTKAALVAAASAVVILLSTCEVTPRPKEDNGPSDGTSWDAAESKLGTLPFPTATVAKGFDWPTTGDIIATDGGLTYYKDIPNNSDNPDPNTHGSHLKIKTHTAGGGIPLLFYGVGFARADNAVPVEGAAKAAMVQAAEEVFNRFLYDTPVVRDFSAYFDCRVFVNEYPYSGVSGDDHIKLMNAFFEYDKTADRYVHEDALP